ncbi:hypothetical protein NW762_008336 [Fusarium torreyae]|uniref:Uncharacterized protein n=1 Tax=Fusarium torreyae TaxID=1237075 RepID=A0A9W8RXH1_9HYPO|nr:hypothetical protein NW762_008336 [Fusarium torreyae]
MNEPRLDIIKKHLSDPDKLLRPFFTSLNGDNSWLMSFPRPKSEQEATGKSYYHVAFEPWLKGAAHVLNKWFVHIAMVEDPEISTFEALEDLVRDIEQAAAVHNPQICQQQADQQCSPSPVDAILLGFHFSDHLHPQTLHTFPLDIPVIASPQAAALIKPWNHFKTIRTIHLLDPSETRWQTPDNHPGEPLPTWLTPILLPGKGVLHFVHAIIWSHTLDNEEIHEVIFQSPHGIQPDAKPLNAFLDSEPKTQKLAMLHGLKESFTAGVQTTYGAKGGLALHRKVGGVEHWLLSHNANMEYTGIFMRLSRTNDIQHTVEWTLEEGKKDGSSSEDYKEPNFARVPNGGSMVLTC